MTKIQSFPPILVDIKHDQTPGDPDHVPAQVTAPLAALESFMSAELSRWNLPANLHDACAYALLGGGKRLRPLLVIHAGAAAGATPERMYPAAAAVEMIHAFSLVHDDLPALDNDDLRRGLPTLHKKHGEAMAILAGDGLMSTAFQILTEHYEPAVAGVLCKELAVGTTRMISGQVLDTLGGFAPTTTPNDRVAMIHRDKTGALIRASCRMGIIAARTTHEREAIDALTSFGEAIGLMFQIVDDLLDVEQSAEHTGKRTGKDQDLGKLTYPGVLGVERSRQEVERLLRTAEASLEAFGARGAALRAIARYLALRTR